MDKFLNSAGLSRVWQRIKGKLDENRLATSLAFPPSQNDVIDPISEKFFASANRLAFLPASQVVVLTTTTGGRIWTQPGFDRIEERKRSVFSQQRSLPFEIPLLDGSQSTLCGMKIYFTCRNFNVQGGGLTELDKLRLWRNPNAPLERYMWLSQLFLWITTGGNRMSIKVEGLDKASNTWKTLFDSGRTGDDTGWAWPGGYLMTFPGNVNVNKYYFFMITVFTAPNTNGTLASTSVKQCVHEIQAFGRSVFNVANPMMDKGHLYSFDEFQNASFPAQVAARGGIRIGDTVLTEDQLKRLLAKL